jgi:hypothetical protein
MDGALLVFDSRSLPNLHALAPIKVPIAPKAHWRHRTFPAVAALILASVFSLVYFVSTQQSKRVTAPIPVSAGSLTATPVNNSTTPASDTNQPPPSPVAPEVNGATKEETKPQPARATRPTTTPAATKAIVKTPATQRKPEEPKKEESKVGSILKKTGRLLKKPFKL